MHSQGLFQRKASMRVFFAASLALVLCSTVFAQARTCPPGFESLEGGERSQRLGQYVNARYQFGDGGCRGKPITIKRVDYRLNREFPNEVWSQVPTRNRRHDERGLLSQCKPRRHETSSEPLTAGMGRG